MTALCKGCLTPPVERQRCSTSGNICMATWYRNAYSFYRNHKIKQSLNNSFTGVLLNFIPGNVKLSIQSGSISKPDKTEQRSSPVAEGQTRPRTAERLKNTAVSNFLSIEPTCLSQLLLKCYWPRFLQIRWAWGDRQHHPWGTAVVCRPPWENQMITIVTIIKQPND